jgi:hypothetical protein
MDPYDSAKADREAARSQFRSTLSRTKSRLKPASLVGEAKGAIVKTAKATPPKLVKTATRHKVVVGGVAAFLILTIFRKTIMAALRRRTKETPHD